MPDDIRRFLTPELFVANLFFLQVVIPPLGSNGVLWSLAYEFWYYIWFPALWLAIRYRKPSLALASLAFGWFNPDLALHFISWLAGAALLFVTTRLPAASDASRWRRHAGTVVGALAFLSVLFWSRTGDFQLEDPAIAVTFAAFLLMLIRANPRQLPALGFVARYGAQASFSFYATHFPIMAFAAALLIGTERLSPEPVALLWVAAVMVISVVIAWAFARLTEARTGNLRLWLHRRWGASRTDHNKG